MTTVPTDVANFLDDNTPFDGEKHPGFKFSNIGDTIKGLIVERPRVVDVDKIGAPGVKEKKLVVAVRDDNGNTWALWAKGNMAAAIKDACTKANVAGIAEGGTIAVRFQDEKDTGKGNPLKVFTAAYQAPVQTTSVDDLLGGQPARQQAPAAAPVTPGVADDLLDDSPF